MPTSTNIKVTKLGPGTLKVLGASGATGPDLSCHLSAGEYATDKSQDDPIPVLCGAKIASAADYTATIGGTVLLDLSDPESIFYWSQTHKGEEVQVEYVPNTEVGMKITGTVTMDPLGIAGDVAANATADFEWAFTDFPTIEPPTVVGASVEAALAATSSKSAKS